MLLLVWVLTVARMVCLGKGHFKGGGRCDELRVDADVADSRFTSHGNWLIKLLVYILYRFVDALSRREDTTCSRSRKDFIFIVASSGGN